MGYLVDIYKDTCMSSRLLSPNMHNHHLEIHSSEKLQDMFTSIISEISISLPLTSLRFFGSQMICTYQESSGWVPGPYFQKMPEKVTAKFWNCMRRNRNKIQEELQGLTELNLCPWLVVSSHLKWISIQKKGEGFFF